MDPKLAEHIKSTENVEKESYNYARSSLADKSLDIKGGIDNTTLLWVNIPWMF